jgi:hypothetical protein
MADEGVHEIQLNGKQLVFMFMAVTVVAVVIFLCGVMVGRGVRAPRATEQTDAITESISDPTAALQAPAPASDPPSTGASASSQEKLTYADRLGTVTPPSETLKEPVATDKVAPEVKAVSAVKDFRSGAAAGSGRSTHSKARASHSEARASRDSRVRWWLCRAGRRGEGAQRGGHDRKASGVERIPVLRHVTERG